MRTAKTNSQEILNDCRDIASLGSLVSSRLILGGEHPPFSLFCLYEIADAVASFQQLEIIRWNFVLSYYISLGEKRLVAIELEKQLRPLMEMLRCHADDIELLSEFKLFDNYGGK